MIPYLIRSGLCLLVLLTAYRVLLEKEKMLRFNRAFLLFSLAFSFIVPFVPMADYFQSARPDTGAGLPGLITPINQLLAAAPPTTGADLPQTQSVPVGLILLGCYCLVTLGLFVRFIRNLYLILLRRSACPHLRLEEALLVFVPEEVVSHTFYTTIFINEAAYRDGRVEPEVLAHELAHVRQRHTIDILFVEVLHMLFWFNPLLILYKRSIRLNHEFLADEAVTDVYKDPKHYQQLLLSKVSPTLHAALSSSLNYKITKKRLIMITTTSNKTRILAKKLAITPLILGALFLFSTKIKAQQERPGDNVKVGFTVPGTDNLGKHPYVQIDGKEYPSDILTNISPSCIAGQATYLKDNAILRYGPTAADGAVIITTHKGGIKYITATEKENLRKESLAKTGFYHRITLKNEDGSSFDKLFINFPNNKGTMNASNKKDCKVGFLVRNKLYNEDQIDEVENFLKTHSRGESGVGDNKIGHVPGVDLSSYDIIFYFK